MTRKPLATLDRVHFMAEERVERRLAAILAGDVAGYSRLMGADEEGTLKRLNAHRREFLEPKIAECKNVHGISYTVVSSAMPRSAARRIDGRKLWL